LINIFSFLFLYFLKNAIILISKIIYCHSWHQRGGSAMGRFDTKINAQDIINAIPGGVAIYKVSDIFETVYYSDGVPELSGYDRTEYEQLIKQDTVNLTYHEDTEMVVGKIRAALAANTAVSFDFRKQHRDGHIVWVNVYAKKSARTTVIPCCNVCSTISPPSNSLRKSWPTLSILSPAVSPPMILLIRITRSVCFVPTGSPDFSAAVMLPICSAMPPIPGA
ncbi:MAG: PAS domain-containing protein, partial [Acidaminococcaceae bacterium]|nr:PAS domain-containing protein [Acidaminococcaceae bacterium]